MRLKAALDEVLSRAAVDGAIPGVVGMVTDGQGIVYEGAFGRRVLGKAAAMTVDTVGLLASLTKAITATAAMQLVERGQLDLDRPAGDWLPQLGQVQVLEGFGRDGQPRLRAPRRPVTLRHLLSHTSGFGYEFLNPALKQYQEVQGLPPILGCDPASLQMPLLFDPGERWEYGIGIDWAGRLIEHVTGRRLSDHLREQVLAPLGMDDTGFRLTKAMRARLAAIHARQQDGTLVPLGLELPAEPGFDMGGAGLYGTLGDYLKFLRMVLNDGLAPGGRILASHTLHQMLRNQIGDLDVPGARSTDRTLTNDFLLPPDIPHRWSLAWLINARPLPTGRPAGSLMWAGLTNCYYWIDPANGLAGALMTQILPFADIRALPLFQQFESAVYRNLDGTHLQ